MSLPSVPLSLEEVLDAKRSALIVWDMQAGIGGRVVNAEQITAKIRVLLDVARAANVLVVWSRHVAPPLSLTSPSGLRSLMKRQDVTDVAQVKPFMQAGTPDVEIIPSLEPAADDLIIVKSTPSFFVGTPLELRLRSRDITTLVLTGVATEQGIEMTARHALTLGFFAVVAEDAVASFTPTGHQLGLAYLRNAVDVVHAADIAKAWRR